MFEKEHSSGLGLCLEPNSANSLKIIVDNLNINTGLKDNYNDKLAQEFVYEKVFPSDDTNQKTIFEIVAKPLISAAFEGINGTPSKKFIDNKLGTYNRKFGESFRVLINILV